MQGEQLIDRYPAFADLERLAKDRIPRFAWEYLDSGTGDEMAIARNRVAMAAVLLLPSILENDRKPDISTRIFDQEFKMPVGVAPVGMSGLMWPGAELMLARAAREAGSLYCLSTVGCETPEDVGAAAGAHAWFQLYPFDDWAINADLIDRASRSGFSALVVTIDVPMPSMRERQRRAGLRMPPATTLSTVMQVLARPGWAMATRRRGKPAFRMLEKYVPAGEMAQVASFVARHRMGALRPETLREIRKAWKGPLVIKGVMSTSDASAALAEGADGIWVSNHGGRQLDSIPASIDVLPQIADLVAGRATILFDSGARSGEDAARAIALGASFVFAGRPFLHACAALGQDGAHHAFTLFRTGLENVMTQLGAGDLSALAQHIRIP